MTAGDHRSDRCGACHAGTSLTPAPQGTARYGASMSKAVWIRGIDDDAYATLLTTDGRLGRVTGLRCGVDVVEAGAGR